MKHFSTSLAVAIFSLSMTSCSQDRENEGLNSNPSLPIPTSYQNRVKSGNPLDSFNENFSSFTVTKDFKSENGWSYINNPNDLHTYAELLQKRDGNKAIGVINYPSGFTHSLSYLVTPQIITPSDEGVLKFGSYDTAAETKISVGFTSSKDNMADFVELKNFTVTDSIKRYSVKIPQVVNSKYIVFRVDGYKYPSVTVIDNVTLSK